MNIYKLIHFGVWAAAFLSAAALFIIIFYILINGAPHLTPDLFSWRYTSENVSMTPAIINTAVMTFLTLLVSVPLGLFTAIYLVEYSKQSRFLTFIRLAVQTLAGIPSIVYGLFGLIFFVTFLSWGFSILSGALTLAIMVLPVIIRTGEEALIAVPSSYREGSFALGATRLRTVFRVVIPAAAPGIMAGIILAIGRIVGETAALIYTAGTVAKTLTSLASSGRTLAVHMYVLSSEGFNTDQAAAAAVVLLALVAGMNALSLYIAKKAVSYEQ
ncbi:MAG: phosphate ABC transporter permease PstA [Deferribacteraceae bacterium]|jgi:phosphate transport system permease protein|nr:phosphate ABC transporter permease PstA [Deferribacteraceae bacterium]